MKKVIYLLLALAFAMPSHGQVELKKHSPDLAGHNALIREWLDTVSISYVVTEKGEKYFVRDIRGHTTAVAASIPHGMTITDMEVVTEYLYFCGTYDTNNTTYGMVGVLNIANTFSWGQPYHIGLFGWSNDSINGYIRMTRPRRVGSTWNYQTSDLFVSVVGDIERKDSNGNLTIQTGVCETFTDATFSPWQCGYYWCDNPDIVFTDITETDNYYVAVGRHSPHGLTLIKRFNVSTTRPFTRQTNITDFGNISYVQDDVTEGTVLAVATKKDSFVTVNYYSNSTSAGSTVNLFDAHSPTFKRNIKLQQSTTPAVSSSWALREIQYDSINKMTFVLQDMDYPVHTTIRSTICEYNLWSSTQHGLFTVPGYPVYGMGAWSGAGFQIAGDASGNLTYMRKQGGASSVCGELTKRKYLVNSLTVDSLQISEHGFGYNPMITTSYQERLIPIKIFYDCIQQ